MYLIYFSVNKAKKIRKEEQDEKEEAAINYAKAIDEAGYSISLRNGKILTCYSADNEDGSIKDILTTLLAGKPVSKKIILSGRSCNICHIKLLRKECCQFCFQ
jgi:hypothetical protein